MSDAIAELRLWVEDHASEEDYHLIKALLDVAEAADNFRANRADHWSVQGETLDDALARLKELKP